ncbi:hypothetical protein ACWCO3_33295 [Micromonospora sp. NPDC002411]
MPTSRPAPSARGPTVVISSPALARRRSAAARSSRWEYAAGSTCVATVARALATRLAGGSPFQ